MKTKEIVECCFILNMDLNLPVSDVHLVLDVINTFDRNKILIIKKGNEEQLKIDETRTISLVAKKAKKRNLIGRYFADLDYIKYVKQFLIENNIEAKAFFIQSSPLAYFIVKYLKRKTKARVVYNAQDVFPDNIIGKSALKKIAFSPFSLITKKLYRMVDHIITISDNIKDTIVRKKVDPANVSVIHNWAKKEDTFLPSINFRKKHNLENKFIVLYAGNIGKFQNVKMILDTAKTINNSEIIFAIQGDGFERKELEEYAISEGLKNVVFLPQAPLDTMSETYRSVDINLVTLKPTVFRTALPSKIPFCLSNNVPLIITVEEEASIRNILKQDALTAFVLPNDTITLKETIIRMYNEHNDNKYIDTRSRLLKKYFDAVENPKKYHAVITNLK